MFMNFFYKHGCLYKLNEIGHRNSIVYILERRNSWPDEDINYCPIDIVSHSARTKKKAHEQRTNSTGNHETLFPRVRCQPPELLTWTCHRHRMQNRLADLTRRLVDPPPVRKAVMQCKYMDHGCTASCNCEPTCVIHAMHGGWVKDRNWSPTPQSSQSQPNTTPY